MSFSRNLLIRSQPTVLSSIFSNLSIPYGRNTLATSSIKRWSSSNRMFSIPPSQVSVSYSRSSGPVCNISVHLFVHLFTLGWTKCKQSGNKSWIAVQSRWRSIMVACICGREVQRKIFLTNQQRWRILHNFSEISNPTKKSGGSLFEGQTDDWRCLGRT